MKRRKRVKGKRPGPTRFGGDDRAAHDDKPAFGQLGEALMAAISRVIDRKRAIPSKSAAIPASSKGNTIGTRGTKPLPPVSRQSASPTPKQVSRAQSRTPEQRSPRATPEVTRSAFFARLHSLLRYATEGALAEDSRLKPARAETDEITSRMAVNPATWQPRDPKAPPVELQIGLDFGTSSTKIVIGMPYHPGAPAFAIPVPPFARADNHPHLWAERLWLREDTEFSLLPSDGATLIRHLKRSLMLSVDAPGDESGIAPEEAACAFLALQIRQAKGWMLTARRHVLREGRLQWHVNFGFPAASLNVADLAERYRRICAAALLLNAERDPVTRARVRQRLADIANDPSRWLATFNAALAPEIAAAVAGFAHSARLDSGLFAMVDVGGGTVDCCTFNLFRADDGSLRCPIFEANVETLGVESWNLCAGDTSLERPFRRFLDQLPREAIWNTKTKRYTSSDRWQVGLPIFLVGGGSQSAVHRTAVVALDGWLRGRQTGCAGTVLRELDVPENLDHECDDPAAVQRLCVAVGLGRPFHEIPEKQLPHEIKDMGDVHRIEIGDRYVGPELL